MTETADASATALRVLVVDDEEAVRASLAQTLDLAGLQVEEAANVDAARKSLAKATAPGRAPMIGAVISDMRMPGDDGFALLSHLTETDPDLPLIFLTGHGDVSMAVQAINAGAYDFLEKPTAPARLVECVRRALDKRRLLLENQALRERVARLSDGAAGGRRDMILGDAPASRAYAERLSVIASADADVLITGETGAGKEGAARAIHAQSSRRKGPFITVDCGALAAEASASALFGHEIGAFPGARVSRAGKFEDAEGGVIFLDNVDTLSLAAQAQLLRVLQEREVTRLGAARSIRLDIRVLAATKADLRDEMAAGRFREDLYYRLDVANLHVPSLRERADDVPVLFSHFAAEAASAAGRPAPDLSAGVLMRLTEKEWPGNVRELKNAAERYALGLASLEQSETVAAAGEAQDNSLAGQMEAYEKRVIREALSAAKGRVAQAAKALGLPRKTLYDKLARHGLSGADFR